MFFLEAVSFNKIFFIFSSLLFPCWTFGIYYNKNGISHLFQKTTLILKK